MNVSELWPDDTPEPVIAFLDAHPEIEVFEAILPDINGKLRGKWILRPNIHKAFNGGLKLPLSTLALDIWGRDPRAWVFDSGDADGICRPDIQSLAPVPWLERPTGQFLLSLDDSSGDPCGYDPRNILRGLVNRFESEHGLTPVVASEMEFYLVHKECDAQGRPSHTQTARGGAASIGGQTYSIEAMQDISNLMHEIRDACAAQHLPIDTLIAEAAPSQYEINLIHQPNALLAADHGLLLQRAIKGVANRYGIRASFMAKPFTDLAGNGLHVHCSALNSDNTNAFDNGTDEGSELLHRAISGCLATMNDSMLLFAPHLNSYRRFQSENHAPMAPTWGYENRTVAVRVPAGDHKSRRIEHRVAGADANLYLVISAIIAGMQYGIENKLDVPPPVVGDAYKQFEPALPTNWQDALEAFSQSKFIRDYLGQEVQTKFANTKRQEIEEFNKHVTPLEYQSYL